MSLTLSWPSQPCPRGNGTSLWEAVPTPGRDEGSSQAVLPALPQRVSELPSRLGDGVQPVTGRHHGAWLVVHHCDPQVGNSPQSGLRGLGQVREPLGLEFPVCGCEQQFSHTLGVSWGPGGEHRLGGLRKHEQDGQVQVVLP